MSPSIAYLNIRSILSDRTIASVNPTKGVLQRAPTKDDIQRELAIHVAKNNVSERNGTQHVSHMTWEFKGVRANFLACATFDGTGPNGTTIDRFAMPGQKLNRLQKALMLLTLIDVAITSHKISASWEFMVEKISQDFDGGVSDLASQYESITKQSQQQADDILRFSEGNAGGK